MGTDPLPLLRRTGRLRAGALAETLGVSRATLMRAIREAGEQVVVLGRARRTTYAARRSVRGEPGPMPLYRVGATGEPREVAHLFPTDPAGSCAVRFHEPFAWPLDDTMREGWFDGLPYPVLDMRPQGFLGRHFAQHHAEMLHVSAHPDQWSDDDVLHALSLLGEDMPGDLIVGEAACRRWLERLGRWRTGEVPEAIDDDQLAQAYPERAARAMAAGEAGSSAGGEFPKFTAVRRTAPTASTAGWAHVLVKFSGSDGSEGSRRWADLLVCEHLAHEVMRTHLQVQAARSVLHVAGGRVFLEVERFDRLGLVGRSGLVSWGLLNGALFGVAGKSWGEVGLLLAARAGLPPDDAAALSRLAHFGALIANTDMHDGNLSFVPTASGVGLAPAYDMVPMAYAPLRGVELPTRDYAPRLPLPAEQAAWAAAVPAALELWDGAAADGRISDGFRRLCADNARILRARAQAGA